MHEGDCIREQMGLRFPSIFDLDVSHPRVSSQEQEKLYNQTFGLLNHYEISTKPIGIRVKYSKPTYYLAPALVEFHSSWESTEEEVKHMALRNRRDYREA